jgi:hypothetical protein
MKVTKIDLRRIIREEKNKLLKEQLVPIELIEQLNSSMTAILDHIESTRPDLHPYDVPLEALEIIEQELEGFKEYLGSGYNAG